MEGLLKKDIEEYGVLKLTKKAESFLKKPKSFSLVLNKMYDDANADDEEGTESTEGAATDERLMTMLMELRQQEAKKKSLPPFVIFLESSLQDMATFYPITLEGLEKCQGVSKFIEAVLYFSGKKLGDVKLYFHDYHSFKKVRNQIFNIN